MSDERTPGILIVLCAGVVGAGAGAIASIMNDLHDIWTHLSYALVAGCVSAFFGLLIAIARWQRIPVMNRGHKTSYLLWTIFGIGSYVFISWCFYYYNYDNAGKMGGGIISVILLTPLVAPVSWIFGWILQAFVVTLFDLIKEHAKDHQSERLS